ncbi:MAG: thioredoxin domain-containing protein, partial [Verrucomicrobiota bacterium]
MSAQKTLPPIQPDDHVRGDPDAPVTIVEYGDYDCPHTRAAQANVDQLMAGGGVRIVFRYFPLRNMHPSADILARIAEASARQGLFWPMHDHLMKHRRGVQRDDILNDAAEIGLDLPAVQALLTDEAVAARIDRDLQGGRAAGVHSTPSFFFNGVLHDGHYDQDT